MRALVLDGEWDPRKGAALSADEVDGKWAHDARQAWRHPSWALADVAPPAVVAPDDVLIRVRAAGLAVSTRRMTTTDADGYVVLPYRMGLPVIPGHEFAGEVVEIGTAVVTVRPGDAVTAETLRPCGSCGACAKGVPNSCQRAEFAGFTRDGGLAEFAVVPATAVHSLESLRGRFDDDEIFRIGALCEPAAVVAAALFEKDRHLRPGMRAAVFGCGPIGLAAVALARVAGAATVLAFDPIPERAALGLELGADRVGPGTRSETVDIVGDVLEATLGRGVDVAIDATGAAADVLPTIQRILAPGGHVVQLGVGGPPASLMPIGTMVQGATHTFSMGHLGGFGPVIDLHAAGRLDLRPMIGSSWPLARVVEAMSEPSTWTRGKALVLAS